MSVKKSLLAALALLATLPVGADRLRPDVQVNIPEEVFSTGGQRSQQQCIQCCVYQDQNYSEGAVIKADGVLLQCQRDEKTLSTNPLVWRRVRT